MKRDELIKRLTIALLFGILLMSLGVFLVGKHIAYGNVILSIASFIVYIVAILLAWKI